MSVKFECDVCGNLIQGEFMYSLVQTSPSHPPNTKILEHLDSYCATEKVESAIADITTNAIERNVTLFKQRNNGYRIDAVMKASTMYDDENEN